MHSGWLEVGDGWKGEPESGPYDAIHVGAAAACIKKFKALI